MSAIIENQSLKQFNSFGMNANARFFADCKNKYEIKQALENNSDKQFPLIILGGGSNILFTHDVDGLVIRAGMKGIDKVSEDKDKVYLRVEAGENWDDFVAYCVNQGYRGIENLSLIPGNVGSCPIQNIGAYGMEVKDSIESVEVIYLDGLEEATIQNAQCHFGYRDSIFKRALKGKVVILAVNFKLSKKGNFILNYGNVAEELKNFDEINLATIREAIIQIRRRKLPDPSITGNAGSFFKNPVIPSSLFEKIRQHYPAVPNFVQTGKQIKIPAAWLIEQCGWKGKRIGYAGVHENQPLVIVNYGKATGNEILELASSVRDSVFDKFEIELEFEVNIL